MTTRDARPRPQRLGRWARRRLLIIDFGMPAPEIGSDAYRQKIEAKVRTSIASGAVDLGTGDMLDAMIEADRRVDQCRLTDEALRYRTLALRVMHRHQRRRDHAENRRRDLTGALVNERTKLAELDLLIGERRQGHQNRTNGTPISTQNPGGVRT